MNVPHGGVKLVVRGCVSLAGQTDAEWVGWWYDQAHRGNGHVQTSRTSNIPFTALTVVLQDGLISLINHFLWSTEVQSYCYTLLTATNTTQWMKYFQKPKNL